jgi:hypothetical protein
MKNLVLRAGALFALCVLASYVAPLLWVPGVAQPGYIASAFVSSPVILFLPWIGELDPGQTVIALAIYVLVLAALSLIFNRWRSAFYIFPTLVFVFCLVEGVSFSRFIGGLNALGHS